MAVAQEDFFFWSDTKYRDIADGNQDGRDKLPIKSRRSDTKYRDIADGNTPSGPGVGCGGAGQIPSTAI